jgi:hypothetical protein
LAALLFAVFLEREVLGLEFILFAMVKVYHHFANRENGSTSISQMVACLPEWSKLLRNAVNLLI